MVKPLELPLVDLSIDPGPLSVELPWIGHSRPRTPNVTHVEPKYPLIKMSKTSHTSYQVSSHSHP